MKLCNLVLTSKGGVGKSFIAWILAQYGKFKGYNIYCADTDPGNPTFARYKALQVHYIDIANDEMQIDRARFDDLVDNVAEHEGYSVIDTGSTTFFPLMSYVTEASTFSMLREEGVRVVIHVPIVGGSAVTETLLALESILKWTDVEVVIWLNGNFGVVELNGKPITETQLYKKFENRVLGIVNIKTRAADTFGVDFSNLLRNKLTFDEVGDHKFKLSQRQRFAEVRRDLYEQLDTITV
ncbi:nucleotide-binding protein [Massilia phyllosphaerae]|uniref:nucleotide-binding protein n=1 Tax=Massilia phyllosphaerae TaxID=3106034 RepID=UPI002B1CD6BA|nr:conjugal transfer protein TraL [Massilia sp. SGZ-792]